MALLLSRGKFSCRKLSGCESVSLPENIVWGSNRAIFFFCSSHSFFLSKGKIWPNYLTYGLDSGFKIGEGISPAWEWRLSRGDEGWEDSGVEKWCS